jgi:hypothetical protein
MIIYHNYFRGRILVHPLKTYLFIEILNNGEDYCQGSFCMAVYTSMCIDSAIGKYNYLHLWNKFLCSYSLKIKDIKTFLIIFIRFVFNSDFGLFCEGQI